MQKIVPHLWFNKEAVEAAEFYTNAFGTSGSPLAGESKILHKSVLTNTPSGDCDVVRFQLAGLEFVAISAGPYFTFNPSISFMLNFDPASDPNAREHLDMLWKSLSDGGEPLMELGEYPFSKRYGWIKDKYGLTWQLILTDPKGEPRPFIIPSMLFVQDNAGRAEEAIDFYVSTFAHSARGMTAKYPAGMEPDKEGSIMFADFQLEKQWFVAMDSAHPNHAFTFNEAVSLLVRCKDQEEIDAFWAKLSRVPAAEQCGWCKDQFGVSWQIAPTEMLHMMESGDQATIDRVTQAFLPMKKLDLAALRSAALGK